MEITKEKIKPAWATGKCQRCSKPARFMVVMLCDECIAQKDRRETTRKCSQ